MEKIEIYQVDAFTDKLFSGNPAAVCILDTWMSDELMQSAYTSLLPLWSKKTGKNILIAN